MRRFAAKGGGAVRRRTRVYRALLWALLALALALAALAGWQLWRIHADTARARALVQQMRQASASSASVPEAAPDASAPDGAPAHVCPVDFAALQREYPDVTAWLTGCGGEIDTPVAQAADNTYYLNHLLDGTRNILGTAFLDSANSAAFSDDQSLIFGHHMDTGGGVFAPLLQYQDPAYWQAHPAFVLHTPDGCYTASVFAAFIVQERAYPYVRRFADTHEAAAFFQTVRSLSDIDTPVTPAPGDRVLTLCTCTSKTNDLRFVVCTQLEPLA